MGATRPSSPTARTTCWRRTRRRRRRSTSTPWSRRRPTRRRPTLVGDKFVSTKDYTYETYDSAKTYTYDTTLSIVENAQAMAEKMMLAMGSRKEAPETVAAEAEVMEA